MGQFFLGSRYLCADIPKDRLTCRPGDCIAHKSVPHEADRTIKGDSLKKADAFLSDGFCAFPALPEPALERGV